MSKNFKITKVHWLKKDPTNKAVKKNYKYIAVDKNGSIFCYKECPEADFINQIFKLQMNETIRIGSCEYEGNWAESVIKTG